MGPILDETSMQIWVSLPKFDEPLSTPPLHTCVNEIFLKNNGVWLRPVENTRRITLVPLMLLMQLKENLGLMTWVRFNATIAKNLDTFPVCKKYFCNYYKRVGHMISEYKKLPQNRNNCAYHVVAGVGNTSVAFPPLVSMPAQASEASLSLSP